MSFAGSGSVSFGGSGPMSFCRFALARCRIGGGNRRRLSGRGARRPEEEVDEKTSWGKGRDECSDGGEMKRTGGLTRTLDSHKKCSVELALPVTEPLLRHRVHKNFNALSSGLGASRVYGRGAPFLLRIGRVDGGRPICFEASPDHVSGGAFLV